MTGEDRFVARLVRELPPSPRVLVGPGDDAAVVAGEPGPWVVTTDMLVESVDFLPGEPAQSVGRRAMAVNLSDLAAMGARPEFFLLSIAFPGSRGEEYPLSLARGALARAAPFGAALAGGDLSHAESVMVSVTLWGRPEREPILRSGARPGDQLFLTGSTGRAAAGLALAGGSGPEPPGPAGLSPEARAELLAAYTDPEPRVPLALELAREGLASAAIDVSDGLGIDAGRLSRASGVKVVIEGERLPISPALSAFARLCSLDPVELALSGGDDYELLFTVPPGRAREIGPEGPGHVAVRRIGRIERGEGAVFSSPSGERDISSLGYDHLRARP